MVCTYALKDSAALLQMIASGTHRRSLVSLKDSQSGLAGAGDAVVEVDGPEVGLVVDQVHVGVPAGGVVVAAGEAGAAWPGRDV